MAPVARGLAGSHRVVEPFQRGSGGERLTVARHVADLHEVINFYAGRCRPALLGASWGAMLALAYAATHPSSTGRWSSSGVEPSIWLRVPSWKEPLPNE